MKQIVQDLKTGSTLLEDVPVPVVRSGQLLIHTTRSLISLGTERMLVQFGKAGWLQKARQQPEKVKQVLEKVRTDGLKPTMDAVFNKLGQPLPLGYCNVGVVLETGKGVTGFKPGDRVASNGPHAEMVSVPVHLAAKIPDEVSDEEAAFTVIGAIGLQGIRLAAPTLGETVVVFGLGLIGQLAAQLLLANGCRVIGFDVDPSKTELAASFGVEAVCIHENTDPVKVVHEATAYIGADAVLITASGKGSEIIAQSAKMSRKRGRIVLVGVTGLDIDRSDFYEKELTFQVSCSYGPGRYDENYEQGGHDYPPGFVRWTEQRNFQAVLDAIARKRLHVTPLISDRIALHNFQQIYKEIGTAKSVATILEYPGTADATQRRISFQNQSISPGNAVAGIIGAGNFTGATLLPALKDTPISLKYIASSGGLSGTVLAKKHGINHSITDYRQILDDADVDLVMITTRHGSHASLVAEALHAGKHVFVEKPLAITEAGLQAVNDAVLQTGKTVQVGFNRRFAPLAIKMKQLLGSDAGAMHIVATMNAGFIPPSSWVHDLESGGGRILGEACHFIDLCSWLAGAPVVAVCMNALGTDADAQTDNASILLRFANGSNAVVNYFANGSKSYSKERIEVFHRERTLILDNWRRLDGYGFKGFSKATSGQDKGHTAQFRELANWLKTGGEPIIPYREIENTTRATLAAVQSFTEGRWIHLS